jgi:hypothetical protein
MTCWAVPLRMALPLIFVASGQLYAVLAPSESITFFSKGTNMAIGDKPVKVFKHRGISVSVFENTAERDGQQQTFYKASVRRTFKQGDEFVSNANFSRDEIPITRLLMDRAWQWMLDAESQKPADDSPCDDPPKKRATK